MIIQNYVTFKCLLENINKLEEEHHDLLGDDLYSSIRLHSTNVNSPEKPIVKNISYHKYVILRFLVEQIHIILYKTTGHSTEYLGTIDELYLEYFNSISLDDFNITETKENIEFTCTYFPERPDEFNIEVFKNSNWDWDTEGIEFKSYREIHENYEYKCRVNFSKKEFHELAYDIIDSGELNDI